MKTPRRCVASGISVGALAGKHDAYGIEEDENVEKQGVVLDVIEIVLELFGRVLDGRTVMVANLCPAGNPRLDAVPYGIERDFLGQLIDEEGAFGTGPDQAHIAFENAEQLGQLINPEFADDLADLGR